MLLEFRFCVQPTDSLLPSKQVRVQQAPVVDASDKETSPAQARAVSQPKDGACLFRAVAHGLQWMSGKKQTTYSHRDLRAKANEHIRKHSAQYLPEWDRQGPSLERLKESHPTAEAAFEVGWGHFERRLPRRLLLPLTSQHDAAKDEA